MYDAITLELLRGSPFASKAQAAKALRIPRATLDLVIDKGRTAGSKAIYAYSIPLNDKEIQALIPLPTCRKKGGAKSWMRS